MGVQALQKVVIMGMRVGIMGSGSALAKNVMDTMLDGNNYELICFQRRKPKKIKSSNLRYHSHSRGIPGTPEILETLDVLVYCIGTNKGKEDDIKFINTVLLKNLLEILPQNVPIIFISSVSVIHQNSIYANSKKEAEKLVKSSGNPYVIIRPSLLYGRYDKNNLASLSKKLIYLPVIPSPPREFKIQPVYMEDLALFIKKIIDEKVYNASTLTCSNSTPVSAYEVIRLLTSEFAVPKLIVPLPLSLIKLVSKVISFVFTDFDLGTQLSNMTDHPRFISTEAENLGFKTRKFKGSN